MDTPLFGETKPRTKILVWGTIVVLAIIVLFSIGSGVVFAFMNKVFVHVLLVLLVFLELASVGILFWWYRDQEDRLSPKFKWLIFFMIGVIVFTCVVLNIYAWTPPKECPPMPKPISCGSTFYRTDNQTCMSVEYADWCAPPYCLFFESYTSGCCGNCSMTLEECKGTAKRLVHFNLE
eukprot:TRINITY_DN17953_c0_g1_i1.p1 TRINITY_DN17953_c0_g1~~TRINITY_DN17953_c0_g1_i1.p1  ORF type:complete len:189 (-),score=52.79 TRINITY_DN17953_c0_g1_i1:43-576(-)